MSFFGGHVNQHASASEETPLFLLAVELHHRACVATGYRPGKSHFENIHTQKNKISKLNHWNKDDDMCIMSPL